jgi:hypothetical protein
VNLKHNTVVCLNSSQIPISISTPITSSWIDSNFYFQPFASIIAKSGSTYYTLSTFYSSLGYDQHSTNTAYIWPEFSLSNLGAELITNGTFNSNVNNWYNYHSTGTWSNASGLDAGHIKFKATSADNARLLQNPAFSSLIVGQYYRFKFDYKGNGPGTVSIKSEDSPSWTDIGGLNKTLIYGTSRDSVTYVWANTAATKNIHFWLSGLSDSTLNLDNISLKSCTINSVNYTDTLVIFVNNSIISATYNISSQIYKDLSGTLQGNSLTLQPFKSKILHYIGANVNTTPEISAVKTNVSCAGGYNGSIDLTITGGTSPYTYHWNDNITTQDRTSLVAGTYSVTVTDNVSNTVSGSWTITSPIGLYYTYTAESTTNGENNGDILLYPSGGTPPYTFLWRKKNNNNWDIYSTNQNIYDLSPSSYYAYIYDNNGCWSFTNEININSSIGIPMKLKLRNCQNCLKFKLNNNNGIKLLLK